MREYMANTNQAYCQSFEEEDTTSSGSVEAAPDDFYYEEPTENRASEEAKIYQNEVESPSFWGFIKYHLFGWLK